MKLKLDYGYMKRIKYIALGFIIVYSIFLIITNIGDVLIGLERTISFLIKLFSPFLWGLIIAYLLFPIAIKFESYFYKLNILKKWSKSHAKQKDIIIRAISLVLTLVVIVLVVILLINGVFIMVSGSFQKVTFTNVVEDFNNYTVQYTRELQRLDNYLQELGISTNILEIINEYSKEITTMVQSFITSIVSKMTTVGRYIIDITFGFVFAFNFITNREYFNKLIENFLRLTFSSKKQNSIKEVSKEINLVFHSFLRGKLIDLTLLSLVTVIALLIIKFDYSFFVGIFAGYTNIIPYLGTWIGIIPAVIIALVKSGWKEAVFVGIYIVVIQQIYYIFVSPRIQGKSVGIHPVFVLLAIFVFSNFFGIMGMILSIPLAGIIKIFIVRWAQKTKETKKIDLLE